MKAKNWVWIAVVVVVIALVYFWWRGRARRAAMSPPDMGGVGGRRPGGSGPDTPAPPVKGSADAPRPKRTWPLKQGSRGPFVTDLQKALGNVKVDGVWGQETENELHKRILRWLPSAKKPVSLDRAMYGAVLAKLREEGK